MKHHILLIGLCTSLLALLLWKKFVCPQETSVKPKREDTGTFKVLSAEIQNVPMAPGKEPIGVDNSGDFSTIFPNNKHPDPVVLVGPTANKAIWIN